MIVLIITTIISFFITALQIKGLFEKPRSKMAIAMLGLSILLLIATIYKIWDDSVIQQLERKAKAEKLALESVPDIDVKLVIDNITDSTFHPTYTVTNNGASEAINVRQFFSSSYCLHSSFEEPPPFKGIPAHTTISKDLLDGFPYKKDSLTDAIVIISYFDTMSHPHSCYFHFVIQNKYMSVKSYDPMGKKCIDKLADSIVNVFTMQRLAQKGPHTMYMVVEEKK